MQNGNHTCNGNGMVMSFNFNGFSFRALSISQLSISNLKYDDGSLRDHLKLTQYSH